MVSRAAGSFGKRAKITKTAPITYPTLGAATPVKLVSDTLVDE